MYWWGFKKTHRQSQNQPSECSFYTFDLRNWVHVLQKWFMYKVFYNSYFVMYSSWNVNATALGKKGNKILKFGNNYMQLLYFSFKPIIQYVDDQFERYLQDESGLNRRHIIDNRVHCCFYFINPSGHGWVI